MLPAYRPDVVIPPDADPARMLRCALCVLDHATPVLGRLVVYDASRRASSLLESLQGHPHRDERIIWVEIDPDRSRVEACREALTACCGDLVLLNSRCRPRSGWLEELAAVAHAEERTACVSPLIDDSRAWLLTLTTSRGRRAESLESIVRFACARLPRSTATSVVSPSCVYLRREAIEAVGLLDPAFPGTDAALDDWVKRARSLGFVAKTANHVYVPCAGGLSRDDALRPLERRELDSVQEREWHSERRLRDCEHTLDAQLTGHAVRITSAGRVSVALDIRHIPPEQVGTRTYAVNLAQALKALPEIDLTLLVRDPAQARGIEGRVVTPERFGDDVALIHKPAQVIDPSELELLFESSAHVVITYQDLIAYRIPTCFPSAGRHAAYCATSRLSLLAVQRIIAYSRSSQAEIAAEFGIDVAEIPVVPLGVEPELFRERLPLDPVIRRALRLPKQYFFSVASDYPHKNLPSLLEAYALFRSRWEGGEPPSLVLAGYSSGARSGLYPRLESEALARGLVFLGPVSQQGLKVLYQNALALVFSSLYEGFGLPPLEAMAAGTPVIAMPISAVPEVGGGCVLYPDGLSSTALTRAMELIAKDKELRAELSEKGRIRVDELTWEKTARNTLEVYRSTILQPSERSLRMRRLLRDAIVHWSGNRSLRSSASNSGNSAAGLPAPIGVRQAYRALEAAVRTRFTREIRRFRRITARRTA